jgi:hypothetical protein
MKLKGWCGGIGLFTALLVFALSLFSVSARAAFLYKNYIIRNTGDQDVLCDPYIVQKDDYVLKIFRQRGEISHTDFPDFLNIFRLINPQVKDINKILPGQYIFIPLRKLGSGSVPDQEFGVVTIPFVTRTDLSDLLKDHSEVHEVTSGDTVSQLLAAHFGRYGTKAYNEGMNLFKTMNPQVEDVNLILVGEKLWLPKGTLQNELWYESLFDGSETVAMTPPAGTDENPDDPSAQQAAAEEETAAVTAGETTTEAEEAHMAGTMAGSADSERDTAPITALAEAAGLLEARLYQEGTYYFPRPGRSDLQLDLAWLPVLETRDGARVLITIPGDGRIPSPEMLSVLKNFWRDLVVADLPRGADLPRVLDALMYSLTAGSVSERRTLTDGGVQVTVQPRWLIDAAGPGSKSLAITPIAEMANRTSPPVIDYLETLGLELKEVVLSDPTGGTDAEKSSRVSFGQVPVLDGSLDRQAFVRNFFGILGINYQANATVSFGYAGIQIQAVTNTLNRPDGRLVLVDFGNLHGEAATTLQKAGFELIQLPPGGPVSDLIPELLRAVDMACEKDPTFTAASRPSGTNPVFIFLPGFLALEDETPQALLATAPVHDDLVRFFKERGIDVVALTNVSEKQSAVD